MSQAKHSKGTKLQVEMTAGAGDYVDIPEQGDHQGPSATSTEHKVSSHDTVGNVDEFLVGMVDPGSIRFPINIIAGNNIHKQLRNDKFSLTTRNYKLLQNTGEFETFPGMVKMFDRSAPVDGVRRADVEIRRLGAATFSD